MPDLRAKRSVRRNGRHWQCDYGRRSAGRRTLCLRVGNALGMDHRRCLSSQLDNPADYYSQAEADEIVDLQTGGATTYDVIREEVVASGSGSAVFLVDEFMREHVTNAIRAR